MKTYSQMFLGFFIIILMVGACLLNQKYQWIDFSFLSDKEITEEEKNDAAGQIREAMLAGETEVTIRISGTIDSIESFSEEIIEAAFQIDDEATSDDFDYLRYKYNGADIHMKGFGNSYELQYRFRYLESAVETQMVNERVKEVLKDLNLEGKSDYKTVKAVHDFIIENSQYDISTNQNSAYGCLIGRYSACQGYAALTYKMMTEAGIECRVITGVSENVGHAWNIVKVNGKWYYLDTTWDDPIGTGISKSAHYAFFLKGKINFKDHVQDEKFNKKEFSEKYPMELNDFGRNS